MKRYGIYFGPGYAVVGELDTPDSDYPMNTEGMKFRKFKEILWSNKRRSTKTWLSNQYLISDNNIFDDPELAKTIAILGAK